MKETRHNQYHKSLNKVVDHINSHLKESLDIKMLAELATISEYHFHRIFKAYIGESMGAYINRLRLERTANLLQKTTYSLADIADEVGYSNQQALSKAFKKHFGITPTAFRNIESFFSSKQSRAKINTLSFVPEFRKEERKELIYLRVIADYNDELESEKAWKKLFQFAENENIDDDNTELIGIGFDDPTITKKERCRYYACLTVNKDIKPQGEFGYLTIEKGRYAVFTIKGSYKQLDDVYDFIFSKWLLENVVELRDTYVYEKYLNTLYEVKEEELVTEIYIPIL